MVNVLAALLLAAQSPAPAPSAAVPLNPAGRALRDLPGIQITYHDLSDKDLKAITKALSKKKPLSPAQQALLGASTNWGVTPRTIQLKKGDSCTVTRAEINFSASADLPRFNEAAVPASELAEWKKYLAATEAQAAQKLWFAYDQRAGFEKAVVGKPCDVATRDGTAALNKMKADAAAYQPTSPPVTGAASPAQQN